MGNTHPERVSTLIGLLEAGVGVRANITRAPISAGDVPRTFADVAHARRRLGYTPSVSLADGVRRFLQWYSAHYDVELAPALEPTRKEAATLRDVYGIAAAAVKAAKGKGRAAGRRATPRQRAA